MPNEGFEPVTIKQETDAAKEQAITVKTEPDHVGNKRKAVSPR